MQDDLNGTLRKLFVQAGIIPDLNKYEEVFMESDKDLNPIQRRLLIRRLLKENRPIVTKD